MPSALYALASDTLIGVIRAWAIARTQHASQALAHDDEATPMAVLGGLFLWLLRLALAPLSTISRVPPLGPGGMPRRPRPQSHHGPSPDRPPDAGASKRPGRQRPHRPRPRSRQASRPG